MVRPWLDRSSYPFDDHYAQHPEGRMHYVDEGSGPPVVMLHGNPTWSFLYRRLILALRDRYRCVAPDLLGFGLSDKPEGFSHHPAEHARCIDDLLKRLDLRDVTLVVHDWGGPIGIGCALGQPERVRRLVILNSWMWSLQNDPYYVAFSALMGGPAGRYLTRRYGFFARFVMPAVYADRSRLTQEIHRHYLKPLDDETARRGSAILPKQIVGASDWLGGLWERRGLLADIPKLIVWGVKDIGFRTKELERWEAAYPDAVVVRLDDVGHYVPEEAPERLADAVGSFLDSTAAA